MTALLPEIPISCVKAEFQIRLAGYGYKHSSQFFFTISNLCMLTCTTCKLQDSVMTFSTEHISVSISSSKSAEKEHSDLCRYFDQIAPVLIRAMCG